MAEQPKSPLGVRFILSMVVLRRVLIHISKTLQTHLPTQDAVPGPQAFFLGAEVKNRKDCEFEKKFPHATDYKAVLMS